MPEKECERLQHSGATHSQISLPAEYAYIFAVYLHSDFRVPTCRLLWWCAKKQHWTRKSIHKQNTERERARGVKRLSEEEPKKRQESSNGKERSPPVFLPSYTRIFENQSWIWWGCSTNYYHSLYFDLFSFSTKGPDEKKTLKSATSAQKTNGTKYSKLYNILK